MASNRCPFCEQSNSATSKFCGACGAALNPDWDVVTTSLVPCPHCGAVNDLTATTCCQCRGKLFGLRRDDLALDELAPSTRSFDGEVFRPRQDGRAAASPAPGDSRPSPNELAPPLPRQLSNLRRVGPCDE